MRMFRKILVVVIGVSLAAAWPSLAQAHVLESNNGVSAVLHMPPDDAPIAGRPTTVGLAFSGTQAGFDINNYDVTVALLRNDSQLSSGKLQVEDSSRSDGSSTVTFPEAGAYRLQVSGKPRSGEQPFIIRFSVRATAGPGMPADKFGDPGIDFWIVSAGSLAVLAITARYQVRKGGRYRQ
jgi:hypothetical protein